MATRIKTVEYAFQSSNAALAANTRLDFAAITLYLPETTRTFRSVRLIVSYRDTNTAAGNSGNILLGIKLGAAAFSDLDPIVALSQTGESIEMTLERDVTSYFTTNFGTGGSQTCQVGFRTVTSPTINIGAKLVITYEYDDAATTHVKTVRIPLESGTGALTTTLTEIGTNQIPALDTFLPESSKVYRNIWFEVIYNESLIGTVNDPQLGMQVDTGTEHLTGLHESALASSMFGVYRWDQGASPAWSTASAHAFKLRSTNVTTAATFNHVAVILHVTYEFAANSSSIINSLVLALPYLPNAQGNAAADAVARFIDLWIEEPGTITQVQSGVLCLYWNDGTNSPSLKIGAGTARSYTDITKLSMGPNAFTQRCDSGGAGGSAWTLARGLNQLRVEVYAAQSSQPSGFCFLLYLNYTSGNDGNGGSRHNQSLVFNIANTLSTATGLVYAAAQFAWLPDSEGWFLNNFGLQFRGPSTNTSGYYTAFQVESVSGEYGEGQYIQLFPPFVHYRAAELTDYWGVSTITDCGYWDRWSNDPDTRRLALTSSRRIATFAVIHSGFSLSTLLTKHSIAKSITGTVSGSSGGTVTLDAYSDRFGLIGSTTRSGNGTYTITWWDDTEAVKVYARESASLIGASDEAVAT